MSLCACLAALVLLSLAAQGSAACGQCTQQYDVDIDPGNDLNAAFYYTTPAQCCGMCHATPGCEAWTWSGHYYQACYLKRNTEPVVMCDSDRNLISGWRTEPEPEAVAQSTNRLLYDRQRRVKGVRISLEGAICTLCKQVYEKADLDGSDSVDEFKGVVNDLCPPIPVLKEDCILELERSAPALLDYIRQNDDAATACSKARLCPTDLQLEA